MGNGFLDLFLKGTVGPLSYFLPFLPMEEETLELLGGKGHQIETRTQLFHFLFPPKFPKENPTS